MYNSFSYSWNECGFKEVTIIAVDGSEWKQRPIAHQHHLPRLYWCLFFHLLAYICVYVCMFTSRWKRTNISTFLCNRHTACRKHSMRMYVLVFNRIHNANNWAMKWLKSIKISTFFIHILQGKKPVIFEETASFASAFVKLSVSHSDHSLNSFHWSKWMAFYFSYCDFSVGQHLNQRLWY